MSTPVEMNPALDRSEMIWAALFSRLFGEIDASPLTISSMAFVASTHGVCAGAPAFPYAFPFFSSVLIALNAGRY
jgi:hypothetical protein